MSADLAASFRAQAVWCERLGSPFTAQLLNAAAVDIDFGGWVKRVMSGREWREADAAPLRFTGALHAAALQRRDETIVQAYAGLDAVRALEAGGDFATRDPDFFASFLQFAPQTNETRRAIALLPAFLAIGAGAPLHMLELGASAGLNLSWDQFQYRTQSWNWRSDGPLIETDWRGPAPDYLGALAVASRAGCDINPLDISDPGQTLRLRAYIWADQPERLARFDAALALAQERKTHVERADAGAWLEAKLAGGPEEGVTILYHSIVWQYFPKETRDRCRAAIEAAAARATQARRFAWVRFEHERVLRQEGEGYAVDVQTWPGGERRLIAKVDPHVRWVEPV